MGRIIKFNGETYEEIPKQARVMTESLIYVWERLGKPTDPLSNAGRKLMDVIIATWEDNYPKEAYEWKAARSEHLEAEKTIHEQIKEKSGRTLASYPFYIFQVMKRMFPEFKLSKRENVIKLVKLWPIFRYVNKV